MSLNPLEQGNLSDQFQHNVENMHKVLILWNKETFQTNLALYLCINLHSLNPLEQGNLSDNQMSSQRVLVYTRLNPLEQGNLSDSTPLEPA